MKKSAATALIVGALSLVPIDAVGAQDTVTEAEADDGDNTGLWGLAGLVGLLGLMGLRRRDDPRVIDREYRMTRPPV